RRVAGRDGARAVRRLRLAGGPGRALLGGRGGGVRRRGRCGRLVGHGISPWWAVVPSGTTLLCGALSGDDVSSSIVCGVSTTAPGLRPLRGRRRPVGWRSMADAPDPAPAADAPARRAPDDPHPADLDTAALRHHGDAEVAPGLL